MSMAMDMVSPQMTTIRYDVQSVRQQRGLCVRGTDCTDCGGVEKVVSDKICTNDCVYAMDGVCDDPRGFGYCALGESVLSACVSSDPALRTTCIVPLPEPMDV
jgi:hypothetical protein